MPRPGFEPAIPATKRPQTYALDHVGTGIDCVFKYCLEMFGPHVELMNHYSVSPGRRGEGVSQPWAFHGKRELVFSSFATRTALVPWRE
jgi:hypothetical protein